MKTQNDFLNIKPLDIERFIKVNELKEVTNPIFFTMDNSPTPDGLLSNEIFGITMADRSNTFAYITLGGKYFLHPLFYSIWKKVDRNITGCVHSTMYFKLSPKGYLEKSTQEDGGETGIEFLRKNIDKIHFEPSKSTDRIANIKFLEKFKKYMFIKHFIVVPAYYRDVNTEGRNTGVGEINKLYQQLMLACNSLREMQEFGITTYDATIGRIEDILYSIYDFFTRGSQEGGAGIAGKFGVIRNAVQSKTTDYSARLIITAPNLKVEHLSDLPCDLDHAGVPLAATITVFYPFVIAYLRNFFADEYNSNMIRNIYSKKDNNKVLVAKAKLKDVRLVFSEDVLKDEIDRFAHGVSNRFRPIELPTEDPKYPTVGIVFNGNHVSTTEVTDPKLKQDENRLPLQERLMTWCDLLYMAAVEVSRDKMVLCTRYPIDSSFNQFACEVNVLSTIKTEPMVINGIMYKNYPYIRKELIGSNTTDKFIDTLEICNNYLPSIVGDYDGDQMTVKGVYTVEANAELRNQLHSKKHYFTLGGKNILQGSNEMVNTIHSLTIDPTIKANNIKFTDPVF